MLVERVTKADISNAVARDLSVNKDQYKVWHRSGDEGVLHRSGSAIEVRFSQNCFPLFGIIIRNIEPRVDHQDVSLPRSVKKYLKSLIFEKIQERSYVLMGISGEHEIVEFFSYGDNSLEGNWLVHRTNSGEKALLVDDGSVVVGGFYLTISKKTQKTLREVLKTKVNKELLSKIG